MTKSWCTFVEDFVLPHHPDLKMVGQLVFRRDPDWFAHGLVKETTSRKGEFKVWAWSQPLWVPKDYIVLTHAVKLNADRPTWPLGNTLDPATAEALRSEIEMVAPAHWQRFEALEWFLRHGSAGRSPRDINWIEEAVGAAVILGEVDAAQRWLQRADELVPEVPWEAEVRGRVVDVEPHLSRSTSEAVDVLRARRQRTLEALKLSW